MPATWTFTCRACGKTQRAAVEDGARRVRCEACNESRAVPKQAAVPEPEGE